MPFSIVSSKSSTCSTGSIWLAISLTGSSSAALALRPRTMRDQHEVVRPLRDQRIDVARQHGVDVVLVEGFDGAEIFLRTG